MSKPLKIAVLVGTFPVVSQTFIVNQINALIEEGYHLQLYALKKGDSQKVHKSVQKHNLLDQITFFKTMPSNYLFRCFEVFIWTVKNYFKINWSRYFKIFNVFKFGREAWSLRLFYKIYWLLLEDDFDIIHAHFAQNAYIVAYLKSLGLIPSKTKIVTTIHGYDLLPNKHEHYKKAYEHVLKETSMFTVNSKYTKSQLLELDSSLKHITILPVGLDTNYFAKAERTTSKTTFDILFCGRLVALKGPDLAIKIAEILLNRGHKHVRLHIVGDGPLLQQLKDLIEEKNLREYVSIKGSQTQESIKSILNSSDVLLLPGIKDAKTGQEEAQGLVIQEAQAMNVPVVVSDVGGMKYGLLPNTSGYVVKAYDIEAFADCIEKLILDESLVKTMGKAGRDYVVEKFDIKILTKQLTQMYKQLGEKD